MTMQTSELTAPSVSAAACHSVLIALGRSASDAFPTRTQCMWAEFVAWLYQHPRRTGDKDGPYVVLADFNGGRRAIASLVASYGVPLDFDSGHVTEAVICAALQGYAFVAYTTASHQPGAERWRVFVPVAAPMNAAEHYATWQMLSNAFPGGADPAAKDPTRLSYLPGACAAPEAARIIHADGALFAPVPASPAAPSGLTLQSDGPVTGWSGPTDDAELIRIACELRTRPDERLGGPVHFAMLWSANEEWLARQYPPDASEQGQTYSRTRADMALAGELAYLTGSDRARMGRLMLASGLARDDDDWRERKVLRAVDEAIRTKKQWHFMKADVPAGTTDAGVKDEPVPTEWDPRPVILLRSGAFDRYTAQAEQLLADTIYVHGHGLVRIGRAAEVSNDAQLDATGTKREAAQAICIPASAGWVRRELMQRAQFWKWDKRAREWERKDCPKEIAENIGDQQAWATFRPLIAISPVPVLRADLSLWIEPGYDALTGVYHQPTIAMPSILPAPTRDDALQALARLVESFNEFPYASREGVSVFLSHIISAVLRPSFDTSPIFLYTSPIAATGKTLLADVPNIIAHGVTPAHSPYSESEELRKVLFSSLLAGDGALALDNVPNGHKVRAPGLCAFATSATYSDRILGASENRKVPNRCTVVLTGNNVTPVSDLARRSLVCRLDANAESARGRKFRIRDLRSHVRQQRAQLIVDVLTVVRAYAFAGRPDVAHPLESFEQWSRLVRDPLVWLGMADPVASQETETDDEVGPLQGAFVAIATATQAQGWTFTAAQLAPMIALQPGLREALMNGGCSEPADPKKLGYWLREQRDRVASRMKLVSEREGHRGVTGWRLRAV